MDAAARSAQDWLDTHAEDLTGRGADEAVAVVEGAGLSARVVPHGPTWMTQELRHDRINLWLDEQGLVRAISAN